MFLFFNRFSLCLFCVRVLFFNIFCAFYGYKCSSCIYRCFIVVIILNMFTVLFLAVECRFLILTQFDVTKTRKIRTIRLSEVDSMSSHRLAMSYSALDLSNFDLFCVICNGLKTFLFITHKAEI